jgi:hypothetical protein
MSKVAFILTTPVGRTSSPSVSSRANIIERTIRSRIGFQPIEFGTIPALVVDILSPYHIFVQLCPTSDDPAINRRSKPRILKVLRIYALLRNFLNDSTRWVLPETRQKIVICTWTSIACWFSCGSSIRF